METETMKWSEFHDGGKAFVEQILVSEEINPKKAGLWESLSELWLGRSNIWVRSFGIEKL